MNIRWTGLVTCILLATVAVPNPGWAGQGEDWYRGDLRYQKGLSVALEKWIKQGLSQSNFTTGNELFDGEWHFATYVMTAMGHGQMAEAYPNEKKRCLAMMELAISKMLSKKLRKFDTSQWGRDALADLKNDKYHHGAYLGYVNLVLSYYRTFRPKNKYAKLNDEITAALGRRILAGKIGLLETYPGQVYPPDNCLVIASIGLHGQATGKNWKKVLTHFFSHFHKNSIDPKTGLVIQSIHSKTGAAVDRPRGSGTCYAVYFLSFVRPKLSKSLYRAAQRHLAETLAGLGVVREYPKKGPAGSGDVDSGPVIMGYGVSPTGFLIAGARIHRDRSYFLKLYRTVRIFGLPIWWGNQFYFLTGGPIGNAILFAMLTARPRTTKGKGNPKGGK